MYERAIAAAVVIAAAHSAAAAPGDYLKSTEDLARIRIGQATAKDVDSLIGKPLRVTRDSRRNWEQWEYRVFAYGQRSTLWVSFSDDGVVREMVELRNRNPGQP